MDERSSLLESVSSHQTALSRIEQEEGHSDKINQKVRVRGHHLIAIQKVPAFDCWSSETAENVIDQLIDVHQKYFFRKEALSTTTGTMKAKVNVLDKGSPGKRSGTMNH